MVQRDGAPLLQELETLAADRGLFLLGVADLTTAAARTEVRRQGGDWAAGFPRAVSLVYRLQDSLVDPLPDEHRSPAPARVYEYHIYRVVNPRLDDAALSIAGTLQAAGYRALPVPTSVTVDHDGYQGLVSHKLAAHLAGLGWVGRSCLLVTPAAGPRVRLATVLTDAPLPAGAPDDRTCGSCNSCVDACPAGAFAGRDFDPTEPLAGRMDVLACDAYRLEASESTAVTICGVCVSVCPHGTPG